MGKIDERGQLYEAHTFANGFVLWYYSDKLHKYYQIAELYNLSMDCYLDFLEIEKKYNDKNK